MIDILIRNDVYNKLKFHPKRLTHVISVALIASSIAKHYNLNHIDAYIAGLIHDYAKYDLNFQDNKYLDKNDIIKYQDYEVNYHGLIAAEYFLANYNINNSIYEAVRNHVFGRKSMNKIEQILFISDSIYLNGTNNSRSIYKKSLIDLDTATIMAIRNTEKYLEKDNLKLNVFQIETLNFYLQKIKKGNTSI